jgi:hypothetical protein
LVRLSVLRTKERKNGSKKWKKSVRATLGTTPLQQDRWKKVEKEC